MVCAACLYENGPLARYCADCGRSLSLSEEASAGAAPTAVGVWSDRERPCPKCPETIAPRARFCANCGAGAEKSTASSRRVGWIVSLMVVGVVVLAVIAATMFTMVIQ